MWAATARGDEPKIQGWEEALAGCSNRAKSAVPQPIDVASLPFETDFRFYQYSCNTYVTGTMY